LRLKEIYESRINSANITFQKEQTKEYEKGEDSYLWESHFLIKREERMFEFMG